MPRPVSTAGADARARRSHFRRSVALPLGVFLLAFSAFGAHSALAQIPDDIPVESGLPGDPDAYGRPPGAPVSPPARSGASRASTSAQPKSAPAALVAPAHEPIREPARELGGVAGVLPQMRRLAKDGALVSAFAVNLRTGTVIADFESDRRVTPASVSKVVLAASALETFGSDHVFKSRFFRQGALQGGTLKGDLVFVGAGDPYLTNEKIWFLTTDVARVGVREVAGDLVLNTSLFGPVETDANRLAGQRASTHAYDSPLSAAAVNFSVLAVVAGPGGAPGSAGRAALEPYELDTVRLSSRIETGAASRVAATRVDKGAFDAVVASGMVAAGGFPVRVYRSVSDADAYAGATLKAFLQAAGVKVRGRVRIDRRAPSWPLLTPVAEVDGFPLDWQIRGLFKVSNNFIGDMLTIQLAQAASKAGAGGAATRANGSDEPAANQAFPTGLTLSAGASALQEYARHVTRQSRFKPRADGTGPLLASGSGLTPENKMSARDVVAVLDRMHSDEREFPSFLAALPIGGAEGTVRKRFDDPATAHLKGKVRAKTGTLTEPVDAVGLAGYSRTRAGDWVAFCFLVNGTSKRPTFGVDRVRDAIDADLATLLPPER